MQEEARRIELLRQVSTRALGEVAEALAAAAVPCMPLKGALHAALDGPTRSYQDVDVLVPPERFEAADAALRRLGYRPWSIGATATGYLHPDRPLPLDLHRAPFPWGLFRVSTADLFARASIDAATFGAPVARVDPLDDYALLVGHFVKDRRDTRHPPSRRELEAIRARGALRPEAVAAHLRRLGLGRAGWYLHAVLLEAGDDPFARAVLDALGRRAPGARALGTLARLWVGHLPAGSRAAAPATHLLDETLPRGARSLAAHGLDSLRNRLAPRAGR